MSIVKDPALAEAGRKKIQWVRDFMPALSQIEARFLREKPFQGLRVAVSVHLEAKTANLGYVLQQGGAEVYLTGSNPLSTQDDVAAAMASLGVETFGVHGVDMRGYEDLLTETLKEYQQHLTETLKCPPHLVIDDGGDLIDLLGGQCQAYADCLIGGCEETTTGILRLKAREKAGILPCPMMAVNDAKAKHYYDNKYGTGQSVWDGIMHTTNLIVAGKTVVVAGYGWCGKGVAMRAAGLGARVIVTEIDPICALQAAMEGFEVKTVESALAEGNIYVTCTGNCDIITLEHMERMRDQAIVCNIGHFDNEIQMARLETSGAVKLNIKPQVDKFTFPDGHSIFILAEGRLVNLGCATGHPSFVMSNSFTNQCLAQMELWQKEHAVGVYRLPKRLDEEVARLHLDNLGVELTRLTRRQADYIGVPEDGPYKAEHYRY